MANGEEKDEKRGKSFINSDLIIQVLIPLLFAVGSGFIMHDRALSALQSASDSNTEQLKESRNFLAELRTLQERVSRMDLNIQEIKHADDELASLTRIIEQQTKLSDEQLVEFRERFRDLERRVDKLEK